MKEKKNKILEQQMLMLNSQDWQDVLNRLPQSELDKHWRPFLDIWQNQSLDDAEMFLGETMIDDALRGNRNFTAEWKMNCLRVKGEDDRNSTGFKTPIDE